MYGYRHRQSGAPGLHWYRAGAGTGAGTGTCAGTGTGAGGPGPVPVSLELSRPRRGASERGGGSLSGVRSGVCGPRKAWASEPPPAPGRDTIAKRAALKIVPKRQGHIALKMVNAVGTVC